MDVSLDIHSSSVLSLIGPNGSSKSTLLRNHGPVSWSPIWDVSVSMMKGYLIIRGVKRDILLISDPFYFFNATLKDMKEFYRVWYPGSSMMRIYEKYRAIFKLDENKTLKKFLQGYEAISPSSIWHLRISPNVWFLDEAFDSLDPVMRLTF